CLSREAAEMTAQAQNEMYELDCIPARLCGPVTVKLAGKAEVAALIDHIRSLVMLTAHSDSRFWTGQSSYQLSPLHHRTSLGVEIGISASFGIRAAGRAAEANPQCTGIEHGS
ncbi:hypothetical protein LCGC14_2856880, partial [marine sediment metagenome]